MKTTCMFGSYVSVYDHKNITISCYVSVKIKHIGLKSKHYDDRHLTYPVYQRHGLFHDQSKTQWHRSSKPFKQINIRDIIYLFSV